MLRVIKILTALEDKIRIPRCHVISSIYKGAYGKGPETEQPGFLGLILNSIISTIFVWHMRGRATVSVEQPRIDSGRVYIDAKTESWPLTPASASCSFI